ncbi:cysteine-rich CWC family protein [Pseudomonas sp. 2FG]|uniref:cysteine-rich CWC family protein n=1 Tax=Pseudomonas sp. 2FG TaxID=2502191 RepID=UPI0010F9DB97|nr:cysteine-rich CWC family protein [Pseudomonas sp. 2FG]
MSATLDPTRCPLCGLSNQCTQADPRTAQLPCWCFSTPIDRAVLDNLPAAVRDLVCLCPNCAQGTTAERSKEAVSTLPIA